MRARDDTGTHAARDIVSLCAEYARRLPGRLREVADALARARDAADPAESIAAARLLLRRLHGTAASHGLRAVGDAIQRIEDALVLWSRAEPFHRRAIWGVVERAVEEASSLGEAASTVDPGRGPGVVVTRFLVVDPEEDSLRRIAALGADLLIDVVTARDSAEALARARAVRPDAALLDAAMPDAMSLARRLRELPGCATLPLAFLATSDGLERRIAAAHAGASLFLGKPLDAASFGAAAHDLLRGARAARSRVLVVDEDPEFCRWAAAVLRGGGVLATTLSDAAPILAVLAKEHPDLVVVDPTMPGVNGLDVCRLLRADPRWADLPVVCVASDASSERRFSAFDAGVDDFLVKPVLAAELLSRVRMRIDRARSRRDRADSDSLTGLLLRRAFVEQADRCLAASRETGRVLSVSLLDLDGFKAVNDAHGHLAGDRVLAALGGVLNRRLRLEDLRARWGGDELAILFPGQRRASAALVLARVLGEVRSMHFEGDRGERFHAGFSAGIAELPTDAGDLPELLRVADRRLYRAKAAGRGRVERVG